MALESIEDFAKRAAAAGVRELWVSIGEDELSSLVVLHVSPRSATPEDAEKAKAAGIATRSFYVEGDYMLPADGQQNFSEAVMRSAMTDAQKVYWLYETLKECEEDIQQGKLVRAGEGSGETTAEPVAKQTG